MINRIESVSQDTILPDNSEISTFTSLEVKRVASLSAVVSYLIEDGRIDVKPNYQVLDLGTGSGEGIYTWRAFGIPDENIVGVDNGRMMVGINPVLLGEAAFVEANARDYLEYSSGQRSFDIISAFRIPWFEHDFTRNGDGRDWEDKNRQRWLNTISTLLRDGNSFYLETYSEFNRLPQPGKSIEVPSLQTSYFSFMGDRLDVPNLAMLKQQGIPNSIMMGYPKNDLEKISYLDGNLWIPCNPVTGKPKPRIRTNPPRNIHGTDEYGVPIEYNYGKKVYRYGEDIICNHYYGYTDNVAVLHRKKEHFIKPEDQEVYIADEQGIYIEGDKRSQGLLGSGLHLTKKLNPFGSKKDTS